jgi:hypothetical protein
MSGQPLGGSKRMWRSLSFSIGLLFEVVAFLLGHAERLPAVMWRISPTSSAIKAAITELQGGDDLADYDAGFQEVAAVVLARISEQRGESPSVKVERICPGPQEAPLKLTRGSFAYDPDFAAELSDETTFLFRPQLLRDEISRLERARVLWTSGFVFVLGALLQVAGFRAETRRKPGV